MDKVRHAIHLRYSSIRTERAYVYWISRYIRFNGMRHSREMGAREVTASFPSGRGARCGCVDTAAGVVGAALSLHGGAGDRSAMVDLASLNRPRFRRHILWAAFPH